MTTIPQNFLEACIDELFEQTDLVLLSDEQKAGYRPQFLAALENRIGNELMPRLSPDALNQFVTLIDNPETSSEEWNSFWNAAIPNFETEIKTIVTQFNQEMIASLS